MKDGQSLRESVCLDNREEIIGKVKAIKSKQDSR